MFYQSKAKAKPGPKGELKFEHTLQGVPEGKKGCGFALLGYCTHQGAVRNSGQPGSEQGPDRIRQELSRLYVHIPEGILLDGGDVVDEGEELEVLQKELQDRMTQLLDWGYDVILIGGDHSIAWPQYQALSSKLGVFTIINFDAHFDMRDNSQRNSGTSFYQILQERKNKGKPFDYNVIGLSPYTNSAKLFQLAKEEKVWYQYFDEFDVKEIKKVSKRSDHLMVNICMDVVGSATAPGVSAQDPLGLSGTQVLQGLKLLVSTGKVRSLAIAETAPQQEEGSATARLAARYVLAYVEESIRAKGLDCQPCASLKVDFYK